MNLNLPNQNSWFLLSKVDFNGKWHSGIHQAPNLIEYEISRQSRIQIRHAKAEFDWSIRTKVSQIVTSNIMMKNKTIWNSHVFEKLLVHNCESVVKATEFLNPLLKRAIMIFQDSIALLANQMLDEKSKWRNLTRDERLVWSSARFCATSATLAPYYTTNCATRSLRMHSIHSNSKSDETIFQNTVDSA